MGFKLNITLLKGKVELEFYLIKINVCPLCLFETGDLLAWFNYLVEDLRRSFCLYSPFVIIYQLRIVVHI